MLLYLKPIYNVICQLYLNLKKKKKRNGVSGKCKIIQIAKKYKLLLNKIFFTPLFSQIKILLPRVR